METRKIVAKRVIYSGRVQGVGFRVTTQRLAAGFGVAGTVRNCPDGSVELLAEGAPGEVQAFLAAVAERMRGYVANERVLDVEPAALQGFRIIG